VDLPELEEAQALL
jgi:hypothetical protein